jgi:subtilisin-like proprotein convertase family protein
MTQRTTPLLPTDPLFGVQWHLYNTGQIAGAVAGQDINVIGVWPDYNGKGVLIAAMDAGFDESHPDLTANYRADLSWDLALNRPGANTVNRGDNHGMPVAGLLVAVGNNSIGGIGVAWGADLIGYRTDLVLLLENFQTYVSKLLEVNAAISTNSWSASNNQAGFVAGARELTSSGRDGLGIITLFSAGNDRKEGFNTNYSSTANNPFTISVAASNADGLITSYSAPGASILVSAPGSEPDSIVSIDRQGDLGYNPLEGEAGDYTNAPGSEFSGTSASAPIAAGVVALILQANPNLGWRDVQEILVYSSRRAIFLDQARDSVSINHAKDWNGGGLATGYDFGFGNIDALAAVRLAESWQKTNTTANQALIDGAVGESRLTVAAGQEARATATFNVGNRVEQVTVTVDLQAARMQDVSLTLVSPNGTRSLLLDRPHLLTPEGVPIDPPTHLEFTTMNTVRNWGESLKGIWTLELANAQTGDVVTLNSWSVRAYSADASSGTTQVFTNEFSNFIALESDRISISSANGSIINAGAVSAGSVLDASGGPSNIGGNAVTLIAPEAFTALITGDGDDVIIGNSLNNLIMGGRGNNILDGKAGEDEALYIGGRSLYNLQKLTDGYQITSNVISGGGTDSVFNVEHFNFGTTSLLAKSALDQTQTFASFYDALFDRSADGEGLRYWVDDYFEKGQTILDVALNFVMAPEDNVTLLDNQEFVTRLYNYGLEREPDASGFEYWINELQTQKSNRGEILLGFVQSNEFINNRLDLVSIQVSQLGDIWA